MSASMRPVTRGMALAMLLGCFSRTSPRIKFTPQMPVVITVAGAVPIAGSDRIVSPLILPAAGSTVNLGTVGFVDRLCGSGSFRGQSCRRIQRTTSVQIHAVDVFAVDSQHHHTRLACGRRDV